MVYRPRFIAQWNDPTTTLDWQNCTMASGAMALDYDTLGRVQVRAGTLRYYSGDRVGGTTLDGLEDAWAHYGQNLHVETGKGWPDVLTALVNGRGVVLQGIYGSLPRAYRTKLNSLTFVGPHAVYLNPEFNQYGDILMGDPLNDRFIWVPQAALAAFANALGSKELGSGKVFFATTDPHTPPTLVPYVRTVVTTANVNIRESASAASTKVGVLTKGTKVTTRVIQKKGGYYTVNGVRRRDWLGIVRNGETDWIARGYTKLA